VGIGDSEEDVAALFFGYPIRYLEHPIDSAGKGGGFPFLKGDK
jgi:hypothetical protein